MTEEEAIDRLAKVLLRLFPQAGKIPYDQRGDEFVMEVPWDAGGQVRTFRVLFAEEVIDDYRDTDEGRREDGDERLLELVREALRDGLSTTGRIERLTT